MGVDPVVHFDPTFEEPVNLFFWLFGDRGSLVAPRFDTKATAGIAYVGDDFRDAVERLDSDVADHDDVGVRCSFEHRQRSCGAGW